MSISDFAHSTESETVIVMVYVLTWFCAYKFFGVIVIAMGDGITILFMLTSKLHSRRVFILAAIFVIGDIHCSEAFGCQELPPCINKMGIVSFFHLILLLAI